MAPCPLSQLHIENTALLICIQTRSVFKSASVAPRSSKKFYANLPFYNAIRASVNWLPRYFVSSKNAEATWKDSGTFEVQQRHPESVPRNRGLKVRGDAYYQHI